MSININSLELRKTSHRKPHLGEYVTTCFHLCFNGFYFLANYLVFYCSFRILVSRILVFPTINVG